MLPASSPRSRRCSVVKQDTLAELRTDDGDSVLIMSPDLTTLYDSEAGDYLDRGAVAEELILKIGEDDGRHFLNVPERHIISHSERPPQKERTV